MKKSNFLHNEEAFTLIEVLAVLAISSIILGAIFSLYIFAFSGHNQAQDIVLEQQDLLLIKNYFDNELKNANEIELMSSLPGEFEDEYSYIYIDENSILLKNNSVDKKLAEDISSLDFTINKNPNEESYYNYSLVYTINDNYQYTMILNNLKEYNTSSTQNRSIIRYKQP